MKAIQWMRRSGRHWSGLALVAMALTATAACDESLQAPAGSMVAPGAPRLVAVTSTQLLAQIGLLLDQPIRLRVLDAAGRPIPSATVKYSVMLGSGAFSSDSTLTDDQGFTEVTFRPLGTGTTIIEARAERPGGTDRVQFTILVLADPAEGAVFQKLSGDGQNASLGSELALPFVVRVLNPDGFPVAGFPIVFALGQAAGTGAGVSGVRGGLVSGEASVVTDDGGLARGFLTVGDNVGVYTATARAAVGAAGAQQTVTHTFTATATAQPAARMIIISGDNQTAVIDTLNLIGTPAFQGRDPNPLIVQVFDAFDNPLAGVAVSWFVSDGGGNVFPAVTVTDSRGIALTTLRDVTVGRNAVAAIATGTNAVEFVVDVIEVEPPPPPDPPADGGGGDDGGDGGDGA